MSTAGKSCCSRGSEPFFRQMKIDGSAGWCYNEAESGYAVTVRLRRRKKCKKASEIDEMKGRIQTAGGSLGL